MVNVNSRRGRIKAWLKRNDAKRNDAKLNDAKLNDA
jgi:hypothetical protein